MRKRTTIEIDPELLLLAKRALGESTTRATVEEALRRAAAEAEDERRMRTRRQQRYLSSLRGRSDLELLASEQMWR